MFYLFYDNLLDNSITITVLRGVGEFELNHNQLKILIRTFFSLIKFLKNKKIDVI